MCGQLGWSYAYSVGDRHYEGWLLARSLADARRQVEAEMRQQSDGIRG
jgi:hypothetical protein